METEGRVLTKKCKIRSKGVMWGHVTQFWNFGTPLIFPEWLKHGTKTDSSKY